MTAVAEVHDWHTCQDVPCSTGGVLHVVRECAVCGCGAVPRAACRGADSPRSGYGVWRELPGGKPRGTIITTVTHIIAAVTHIVTAEMGQASICWGSWVGAAGSRKARPTRGRPGGRTGTGRRCTCSGTGRPDGGREAAGTGGRLATLLPPQWRTPLGLSL